MRIDILLVLHKPPSAATVFRACIIRMSQRQLIGIARIAERGRR
jgi:hypothetical protein